MTTFNKSSLQNIWINGFVPQGSDYTNLIQSQVNIAETALQAMAGPLSVTELDTPLVSATNITATTISAGTLAVNNLTSLAGGTFHMDVGAVAVSAQGSISFDAKSGSNNFNSSTSFNVSAGTTLTLNSIGNQNYNSGNGFNINTTNQFTVSAGSTIQFNGASNRTDNISINYTTNVGNNYTLSATNTIAFNASAITLNGPTLVSGGLKRNGAIVSAAGTAQATGAAISATVGIVRLQGTTDGQATGFLLPAPGSSNIEQILVHEGAVSGNLWPSVGCKINGLGTNAAFALAANTPYYVIYTQASAYAVK